MAENLSYILYLGMSKTVALAAGDDRVPDFFSIFTPDLLNPLTQFPNPPVPPTEFVFGS